jgi:hypothetical protein
MSVALLAYSAAYAPDVKALEVPSFDALEVTRLKIVTRAKEINHAAAASRFKRQGRMRVCTEAFHRRQPPDDLPTREQERVADGSGPAPGTDEAFVLPLKTTNNR